MWEDGGGNPASYPIIEYLLWALFAGSEVAASLNLPDPPIRLAALNHGDAGGGLLLKQEMLVGLGKLAGTLDDDGHEGSLFRKNGG